jgi:hypothetical protein
MLSDGPCLSDAIAVADPVRLIKFGRAGWYSLYEAHTKANPFFGIKASLKEISVLAGNKLLCMPRDSIQELVEQVKQTGPRMSKRLSLQLLALLCVRLDIAVGPFTIEAGELVASHLAVLVRANTDQSFLKTAYPSEPILASASANHLEKIGWGRPLLVLCIYINSSTWTTFSQTTWTTCSSTRIR